MLLKRLDFLRKGKTRLVEWPRFILRFLNKYKTNITARSRFIPYLLNKGKARLVEWSRFIPGFLNDGKTSLVNRLLALLLMGAILIYLIGTAGLWWTSTRLTENNLRAQALRWITDIDELGVSLYISRGKANLSLVGNRIKNFPEIAFVRYYDASGTQVLREFGPRAKEALPQISEEQLKTLADVADTDEPYLFDNRAFGGAYFRIISPVRIKSIRSDGLLNFDLERGHRENVRVVGYIDLGIDRSFYQDRVTSTIALSSLITALIFLAALLLGRRLIKRALTPLTDLQTPLARLAKGETDVRVAAQGDREIVAIGDALNATIGALKERDETLRKLAEHDSLTGLFNRNYFTHLLKNEISRVALGNTSSALLFIDLDRFKYVNDTLGHGAGDRLLAQVASLFKGRVRENDVVSRFGGDEFTVIARNVSAQGAIEVARTLNEITGDFHFIEEGQSFNVSCSIGIAMITPTSISSEEILLHADIACYEAKARGRNCYHVYQSDQQEVKKARTDVDRSRLIEQALKGNTFRLVYQPILSLSDDKREYYEVLLRLPDKEDKLLLPGMFLPIAERFGLLLAIDRWVVTQALSALTEFRRDGRDVTFAINLSGQTFTDPSIVQLIKDLLHQHNINPQAVILEITEQVAIRYLDKTHRLMQDLIDLGCRFALDDFGAGFSSFNYLKRLPISFIKIDGCFIENLATQAVDQAVVKSIVQIAKTLNIQIIAEFVQDNAAVDLLKTYGVNYLQGYYIGKPAESLAAPRTKQTSLRNIGQGTPRAGKTL